jgi:hypothetical protein
MVSRSVGRWLKSEGNDIIDKLAMKYTNNLKLYKLASGLNLILLIAFLGFSCSFCDTAVVESLFERLNNTSILEIEEIDDTSKDLAQELFKLVKSVECIQRLSELVDLDLFLSEDERVLFLNWDSRMGGTTPDFVNLIFYRMDSNDDFRYAYLVDDDEPLLLTERTESSTFVCDSINTMERGNEVLIQLFGDHIGYGQNRIESQLILLFDEDGGLRKQ